MAWLSPCPRPPAALLEPSACFSSVPFSVGTEAAASPSLVNQLPLFHLLSILRECVDIFPSFPHFLYPVASSHFIFPLAVTFVRFQEEEELIAWVKLPC